MQASWPSVAVKTVKPFSCNLTFPEQFNEMRRGTTLEVGTPCDCVPSAACQGLLTECVF